jgi:hypothetical protein
MSPKSFKIRKTPLIASQHLLYYNSLKALKSSEQKFFICPIHYLTIQLINSLTISPKGGNHEIHQSKTTGICRQLVPG